MKMYALCILLVLIAGCQNGFENAPVNMRKGDAFYAAKEYDMAAYYYGKVPEESPLFPQAKSKLDSIGLYKKYWAITTVTPEDLKKISLIDHSASMNLSTMKPLHSFIILNNTPRSLSSITVEFTYYDFNHVEVGKLICNVDAPVPTMKKGVFNRVEPGILKTTFAKSTATLVGAEY
jgi:hypothetical protein